MSALDMRKHKSLPFLMFFILLLPALSAGGLQAPEEWSLRLNTAFSPDYAGGGEQALLDGIRGSRNFRSAAWQGYLGVNLDVVVDLGRTRGLHRVSIGFLQDEASWIFLPEKVEFWVAQDEANFRKAEVVASDVSVKTSGVHIREFAAEFENSPVRFIRVIGKSISACPDWHPGAGQEAWIFADEILIR